MAELFVFSTHPAKIKSKFMSKLNSETIYVPVCIAINYFITFSGLRRIQIILISERSSSRFGTD